MLTWPRISRPALLMLSSLVCACHEEPAPAAGQPSAVVEASAPEPNVLVQAVSAQAEVEPALRYQSPPEAVREIVDAPKTPRMSLSSDGSTMLLVSGPSLPGIEVLAEPMYGLAGERINPRTHERRRTVFYATASLVDVGTGQLRTIDGLPESPMLSRGDWSPDGRWIAFTHTSTTGVELWLVEVEGARARRLLGPRLSATFGTGVRWLAGSERLLVSLVPAEQGREPGAGPVARGPLVEESRARAASNRTYRDLLETPLDDARFTHFFESELAVIEVGATGSPEPRLLRPDGIEAHGVFSSLQPSPDGQWLLVERLVEPYSHAVPWYRFAHRLELWPLGEPGARAVQWAELPAAEEVPIQGVPTGPRSLGWQPLESATLVWAEALDDGDPRKAASHRDRLLRLAAPFAAKTPADGEEITRLEHRYSGRDWLQHKGQYLVREYDRDRKWVTTHLRELPAPGQPPTPGRVLFDRSVHDVYADPGSPVKRNLADDTWVVRVEGEGEEAAIFLDGEGATPEGDRPFLDRMKLAQGQGEAPERLFESPLESWASFSGFVGGTEELVVRREGPGDPPDWFRESLSGGESTPLTTLPHPHPQLDGLHKELITYTREDGVPLSATLYTPPGFEAGTSEPLPLVIWAYPLEYVDADTAGQVRAAPTRFTRLGGTSATLFLTQGYAVMFAAMPVVGDPERMNDTLLEQLELSAKAAIEAAVSRGVADRTRVGIGGHSYGAFMVANLLAHTDLFRAGIARSGAYNRSLTPFGFQSERRNLWEATEAYVAVSPLFAADTLDEPILLIHGEIDDNSGTFPIQTRRLFHALQGLGGTVRKVVLPHEAHGYRARESVLHTLWESFRWFDLHVKGSSTPALGASEK